MLRAFLSSAAEGRVGIVLFSNMTQLDVTGPYEVLARMPASKVHLVAATLEPIRSEHGLTMLPELTFETAPPLDVICVPGGIGVNAAMEDRALLAFLQRQASGARYITSISTGALVLGAAGLLRGYRATTHWLSLELLTLFGAEPVDQRVVIDRNRITAGVVTAGIDFGLILASELCGAAVAHEIQLMIEHHLTPPNVAMHEPRLRVGCDCGRQLLTNEPKVGQAVLASNEPVYCPPTWGHARLAASPFRAAETEGVAIHALEPGTTLVVHTRNSQYRLVVLFDPSMVLVKGGAMFPEATVVRLEGATAGGSALKMGWILVGFHMEMWLGSKHVRSSRVRSISIEGVPPSWASRKALDI